MDIEDKDIELKSEEIQEILSRPPHALIRWGITVFFMVISFLFIGGCFFSYPDTVEAGITITTENPPAWLGAWGYSMQIYFDFLGYSLMAIGMGYMLGFRFPKNFSNPYCAVSVTDFWRRWHITLGRWFREYVYIPLGGNKKGQFRLVINTFIVWFLTGLWHGAAWNFIIWGMFFFILMMLEKFIYLRFLEKHPIIGHLYMLIIIPVSWVIFNISNLGELKLYLLRMFGNHAVSGVPLGGMEKFVSLFGKYWWMLAICTVCATPLPMRLINRYKNNIFLKILFVFLFWICVYLLSVQKSNPFLYFRF